jgi:hypothetical protein
VNTPAPDQRTGIALNPPTPGEQAFARRVGLDPLAVARARVVLNTIAFLPWPEPERVSLLVRHARPARADVGEVLGRLALRAAPISSFDQLIPIHGLGDHRVTGLARALADVDVRTFSAEAAGIAEVWARTAGLRSENAALRRELDRLHRLALEEQEGRDAPVMLLGEIASSVASQTAAVAEALQRRTRGVRLANMELRLECAAAAVDDQVALDLAAPGGGSSLNLSFSTGSAPAARPDVEVPDVVGYAAALARRKLSERGFAVIVSALAAAEGVVSEQTPRAGELVPDGSIVRLLIR